MTIYFADRAMNILGAASTSLRGKIAIVEDLLTEDLETGISSFEATLAAGQTDYSALLQQAQCGNYVLLEDANGDARVFTILDTDANAGKWEVAFYAEDAGLDLINEIAKPYSASQAYPIAVYIEKYSSDSGFTIGLNEIGANMKLQLSWDSETTQTARIAEIASAFNAEVAYRFKISGMRLVGKFIDLYKRRGRDPGTALQLGYNVSSIVTTSTIKNLATALLPSGDTPEGADAPVNLKSYAYDDGDIYLEDGYLKSRSALQRWSRYQNPDEPDVNYTGHILRTYYFATVSQADLCDAAVKELQKISQPEINYEVSIDFLPQDVQLGDRVTLVDARGKQYITARVLQMKTSESAKSREATLGDYLIRGSVTAQRISDLTTQFKQISSSTSGLKSGVADARDTAAAAQAAATEAKGSATSAYNLAQQAQGAANSAQQTAAAAQAAANDAKSTASTAVATANTAKGVAENAQTAAVNAAADAQEAIKASNSAAEKATTAQSTAAEANTAAKNAQTAAGEAREAAQTAQSTAEEAKTAANGKAPISHASSTTTYGKGTNGLYGHVMLSDSVDSTSGTSSGVAATPAAVKKAYDTASAAAQSAAEANNTASTAKLQAQTALSSASVKAPMSHAASGTTHGKGTSSLYGHVKLSDSVSSTLSAAAGGTAATPAAVKAVYDLIGGAKIITGTATIDYGTSMKYADVTFGYTFQNPPFVIAMQVFNGVPVACMIGSVTKTGARFSLQGDFTSSGSREFRWLAIGV